MGALTLKTFPFEVRGWDIEKFESFDPTDGFGSNTKVYISKNQIVQIEPDHCNYNFNIWLTDKGRQFFDAIFHIGSNHEKLQIGVNFWFKLWNKIIKILYIFEHCNKQQSTTHFFTIVFNNLSVELFGILNLMAQTYSFIKLRNIEQKKTEIDLESGFQLNNASNKNYLYLSNLCLLISTNTRYEGYYLNLNLRQRILKGNFKCLLVGSLLDLTFQVSFLGSSTNIIKTIIEGNNFICQDLKVSKNPLLIYNTELLKRSDSETILQNIQVLLYCKVFHKTWNGLNLLNSSLHESTLFYFKQISRITLKDLHNFSLLYFLDVTTQNFSGLKKIIELKLFKLSSFNSNYCIKNKWFFDQNNKIKHNFKFSKKLLNNYTFFPNSSFYENQETYFNTEGFVKRTNKLLNHSKHKNSWQVFRKLLRLFDNKFFFLIQERNKMIFFNSQKFYNFRNFITFQYCPTPGLSVVSFYLMIKNKNVFFNKMIFNFKFKTKKILHTKLKYWLDDFFCGGKDEYSQNSIMLLNCSEISRIKKTSFFY